MTVSQTPFSSPLRSIYLPLACAMSLWLPSAGHAQLLGGNPVNPLDRSAIAAKADPSPFENNPNAVQSAQMQPSLATPFIVLQRIPEPKNRNAIPADIYKAIADKKLDLAQSMIAKELTANPRNVQLRFLSSRIQLEEGQIDAAQKTLLELTQQFPELPEPYNNLAAIYAHKGQLEEAKEYLELALKVQPSFPTALENLGDVYTRLAARAYGRAVQLDKRQVDSRRKMKLAEDILK